MKDTNGRRKARRSAVSLAITLSPMLLAWALSSNALPTGGQVTAGSASISQTSNVLTVNQASQRAALDWQTFNIGSSATVNFVQPNASSVALNRIVGNSASEIYGKLSANGNVFFSNPAGMLFGAGAQVNVGSLMATTLNFGNSEDFVAGRTNTLNLSGGSGNTGAIRNEGLIQAVNSAALVGNNVQNAGQIIATTATLAAGNTVALDLTGDGLIRVRVTDASLQAAIENSGSITATQAVTMTAGQARAAINSVVNNSGTIRATGLVSRGGEIYLEGPKVKNTGLLEARTPAPDPSTPGTTATPGSIKLMGDMENGSVEVGGTMDASAPFGGNGGFIETSAANVKVNEGAVVTTQAASGTTGTWLIDPVDFTIAAGSASLTTSGMGASTLSTSLASTDVSIATSGSTSGNGDIFVNSAVSWSANKTLSLTAHRNIYVNDNISATGSSAGLRLFYGSSSTSTPPAGNTSYSIAAGKSITLSGSSPTLYLGNVQYTVINSLGVEGSTTGADLQGMQGNLSGKFALGSNIDASSTSSWNFGAGFNPIGNSSTLFTGSLAGLGHTINGLTISRSGTSNVGLFGNASYSSSTSFISNLGLTNASVSGNSNVGGLVGYLQGGYGVISYSYASGTVTAAGSNAGGLVGSLAGGTISNSYANNSVTSTSEQIGGLVGRSEDATINNSYATGAVSAGSKGGGLVGITIWSEISNSYATGSVTSTSGPQLGGLVGYSYNSPIANSYSTGNVSGTNNIGGLVGEMPGNNNASSISNSYATGAVTGVGSSAKAGGLVGYASGSSVTNSYATGAVSSTGDYSLVGGLVGWNASGTVTNSYATGAVTGIGPNTLLGGLVATNGGTVTTSFFNSTTNSNLAGIPYGTTTGVTGLTTAQMQQASSFSGFSFTTTPGGTGWVMVNGDGSLNGTATGGTYPMLASEYSTSIKNAHQLQLMAMAPSASYTLANSIGASKTGTSTDVWGSAGFVPVGNDTLYRFTGTFDGLSLTINGLTINRPTTDWVGLFGTLGTTATVQNLGLVGGSVIGRTGVGNLAGQNTGTISNSYASGSVSGSRNYIGGLVGDNESGGVIRNSYATGSVADTGSDYNVGGLSGSNDYATIINSYATGSVSSTTSFNVGGLVGGSVGGTVTNSYWNINTSGKTASAGGTGLTTAQMKQAASYAAWNTATPDTISQTGGSTNTWRIYEGNTAPLLRSFLTAKTLTGAQDTTVTYNGSAQSGGSYALQTNVLGAAATGTNVGFYNGYYSNQQGYDLIGGNLTINTRVLTAILGNLTGTISKVYDGGTTATLTSANYSLSGWAGSDGATVTKTTGTYADRNVGTGKSVSVSLASSDYLATGSTDLSNYSLPTSLSGNIGTITQLNSVAWTGSGGNNFWSTAANWAGGAIPILSNVANVTIGNGATVVYSPNSETGPTTTTLTSLTKTGTGQLTVSSGTLTVGSSSTLNGALSASTLRLTGGILVVNGSLTSADFDTSNASWRSGTFTNVNLTYTDAKPLTLSSSCGTECGTATPAITANNSITLSVAGSLLDGVGNGAALSAPTISLTAASGLGSSTSSPLKVASNNLSASTSSGGIWLSNTPTSAVTLSSLSNASSGASYYSQIGQALNITGNISSSGGTITIDPPSSIAMTTGTSITSSGGAIDLQATGAMTLTNVNAGGGAVSLQTSGAVTASSAISNVTCASCSSFTNGPASTDTSSTSSSTTTTATTTAISTAVASVLPASSNVTTTTVTNTTTTNSSSSTSTSTDSSAVSDSTGSSSSGSSSTSSSGSSTSTSTSPAASTSGTSTAASSEKKTEVTPVIIKTVTIAGSTVSKPASEIVTPVSKKGSALSCRRTG